MGWNAGRRFGLPAHPSSLSEEMIHWHRNESGAAHLVWGATFPTAVLIQRAGVVSNKSWELRIKHCKFSSLPVCHHSGDGDGEVFWSLHWESSVANSACRDCKLLRNKSSYIPPSLLHFRFRGIICNFCIGLSVQKLDETTGCSITCQSVNITSSAGNCSAFSPPCFMRHSPILEGRNSPFLCFFFFSISLLKEAGRKSCCLHPGSVCIVLIMYF